MTALLVTVCEWLAKVGIKRDRRPGWRSNSATSGAVSREPNHGGVSGWHFVANLVVVARRAVSLELMAGFELARCTPHPPFAGAVPKTPSHVAGLSEPALAGVIVTRRGPGVARSWRTVGPS